MTKIIIATLSLVLAQMAFGFSPVGTYTCDDQGTLSVTQSKQNPELYFASLEYSDGSASTLAAFEFPGESLGGTMFRDDEDPEMGKVIMENKAQTLILNFDSGDTVTCTK